MLKVLLAVALLAAMVYAVVWVVERRRAGGTIGPRPKPRMVAPDDDEDFLRSIEPERQPDDDDDSEDPRHQT